MDFERNCVSKTGKSPNLINYKFNIFHISRGFINFMHNFTHCGRLWTGVNRIVKLVSRRAGVRERLGSNPSSDTIVWYFSSILRTGKVFNPKILSDLNLSELILVGA
jgi:hypothetical protein